MTRHLSASVAIACLVAMIGSAIGQSEPPPLEQIVPPSGSKTPAVAPVPSTPTPAPVTAPKPALELAPKTVPSSGARASEPIVPATTPLVPVPDIVPMPPLVPAKTEPAPAAEPAKAAEAASAKEEKAGAPAAGGTTPIVPLPIEPPVTSSTSVVPGAVMPGTPSEIVPGAPGAMTPTTVSSLPSLGAAGPAVEGRGEREFSGEDIGTVLRLLARQARINLVVSDQVAGTVTMRLESVTSMEAIKIIVTARGLVMTTIENVYYVKTPAEQQAEPQEAGSFRFSYAQAQAVAPLLQQMLQSKAAPTVDIRTNTIFYREVVSNLENIESFLKQVDGPTQQVMIEARLVEVTANPQQAYGINWSGVFGNSNTAKTFRFFGSEPQFEEGGENTQEVQFSGTGDALGVDFLRQRLPGKLLSNTFTNFAGQMAILSVPQMSATLRLMNEDKDAEFLANPRIVTADNQEAQIKITRSQPVPQLNFNEQTATAVFGGFEDKTFGNTLIVKPSVNKDNFITLSIRPEISNKVGDETFSFAGAVVRSPVIDTRSLESNVLIQSGDTLAVGGLLQDETSKGRAKVPILGDMPLVGYMFQERINSRTKRNLLIFVTPTLIDSKYGTGLEAQAAMGLSDSGEEYSDPSGWLNNARGVLRMMPSTDRQLPSLYPPPGLPEELRARYNLGGSGAAATPATQLGMPPMRDSVRARDR